MLTVRLPGRLDRDRGHTVPETIGERRYWDDYRPSSDDPELHSLVEKAIPFLEAGDGRNALRILEAIAETFVEDWIEYSSGSDEHLYALFADLGRMMAEAALMSGDLDAEERSAREIYAAIQQDLLRFATPKDDISLVVVKKRT